MCAHHQNSCYFHSRPLLMYYLAGAVGCFFGAVSLAFSSAFKVAGLV
jgi:hypothetical protein